VHGDERRRLVEVGQLPERVHPEQDGAQPGALRGVGDAHGQVEGGRQRADPQRRGDRATGRPHLVDRQVEGGEGVADERELLADPFHRGADQVRTAVLAPQAEVGAAHAGAPPRRTLPEQVRQAQQPVAADGTCSASASSRASSSSASSPSGTVPSREPASDSEAHRTTEPPLFTAPPTTQWSSVSA
jgi:hypothetical protein